MKVLFINRVYPPQNGATGHLLHELAEALAERGWCVTALCSADSNADKHEVRLSQNVESSDDSPLSSVLSPLVPHGERKSNRVTRPTIIRVGSIPFTRASHWRRALSYLSLYPAIFFQALRLPRQDVSVTLTDPPLQLVMGPVLRLFKRGRLIHWAQDIYPEVAEELGVVRKNRFLAKILRCFSTWALRRHDQIVAVGECMKRRLIARGIDPERIVVIPNWAQSEEPSSRREKADFVQKTPLLGPLPIRSSWGEEEETRFVSEVGKRRTSNIEHSTSKEESGGAESSFSPGGESWGEGERQSIANTDKRIYPGEKFRQAHGWQDRLVVMYSGNFGLAHPFESIVKAVIQLEKSCPQLLFVFIGEGSQLPWLREKMESLNNVRFLPPQPKSLLAETLAAADLHLAGMHDRLCGLVVPSKVYGVLAAGRPCLFLGPKESEAAQTILRHQCGAVLPETDCGALVDWLTKWAANPDRIQIKEEHHARVARSVSFAPAIEAFDHLLRSSASAIYKR